MDTYALHDRYTQQAGWTAALRRSLFPQIELDPGSRILEVGCGTGAILPEPGRGAFGSLPGTFYGLDIDLAALRLARLTRPGTGLTAGDGRWLPFPDGAFDAVYCHFLLLWVQAPHTALAEMVRVTRPGGAVLAFAEPDYHGRIDYPPPLDEVGRLQAAALAQRGADPGLGRKLSGLFYAAGLHDIETGLMGGRWQGLPAPETAESEWATLQADLAPSLPREALEEYRRVDEAAWASGQRVLFVPTFFAWGKKAG